MTNYIYGFFASGIVLVALHSAFPARAVEEFVKNEMSAAEVQQYFGERWDISLSDAGRLVAEHREKDERKGEGSGSGVRETDQARATDGNPIQRRWN